MTGGSNVSNAWFVLAEGRASEWDQGVEAFPRLTRESRSSGACQLRKVIAYLSLKPFYPAKLTPKYL